MVCTFFEAFNVPVFWPILVMYFIMLFCITMKRQIKVSRAPGAAAAGGAAAPMRGLRSLTGGGGFCHIGSCSGRKVQTVLVQGHGTPLPSAKAGQLCPVPFSGTRPVGHSVRTCWTRTAGSAPVTSTGLGGWDCSSSGCHPGAPCTQGPLPGPGRLPPARWALRALQPVGGGRRVSESWFPSRTRAGRAGPVLPEAVLRRVCLCVPTQHMIKYRYIPFTHGKRTYKGKEDAGKTFAS